MGVSRVPWNEDKNQVTPSSSTAAVMPNGVDESEAIERSFSFRRLAVGVIGGALVGVGGTVTAGWLLESSPLVQIRAGSAPMKFTTSCSFLLLGNALLAWGAGGAWGRRVSWVSALGVLAIALATLVQRLLGIEQGLESLVVRPFTPEIAAHGMRMTYYAVFCFAALGMGALLVNRLERSPRLLLAVFIGCVCVQALTCMALIGYAMGNPLPLSGGTNMAYHTALSLLAGAWGVMLMNWPRQGKVPTAVFNTTLLAPIAVSLLAALLALWVLPVLGRSIPNRVEVASGNGDGERTVLVENGQPTGVVLAVLAIAACMAAGSAVLAKVGFERAGFLRAVNNRLREEIAQREEAESSARLLVSELDHRVRNTLSQVLSIMESTATGSDTKDEYLGQLRSRVKALSRAHGTLSARRWKDVEIEELLRAVLEPFVSGDGSRVKMSGPRVLLPAKATMAMCMVFYELAANAARHGALSPRAMGETDAVGGHVEIEWSVAGNEGQTETMPGVMKGVLEIRWTESGGPPVVKPSRQGFGTTLIRSMVPYELRGHTELVFDPAGVRCLVRFEPRALGVDLFDHTGEQVVARTAKTMARHAR